MSKFTRFNPENHDPTRQCQSGSGTGTGQCPYLALVESEYCPRHDSSGSGNRNKRSIANYRLTKWQARMEEKGNSTSAKSLRDEIGILRMALESLLNSCHDDSDLVLQSSKISDLVLKVEKLVTSCHRLDKSTGALLDKSALISLATTIIAIIAEHVDDEHIYEAIAFDILDAIRKMRPEYEYETD